MHETLGNEATRDRTALIQFFSTALMDCPDSHSKACGWAFQAIIRIST